jgi:hypothetical protein
MMAHPVPHSLLPQSHHARGDFLQTSVKSSIFTLLGSKFSRSHPAAPICPFSPRKHALLWGAGWLTEPLTHTQVAGVLSRLAVTERASIDEV